MSDHVIAYIALGSNLGDRAGAVQNALQLLDAHDGIEVLAVSSMHETDPVGPPGQQRYVNAAAKLRTTLPAADLLTVMLSVERELGRERDAQQKWGPRTIDLDLLLYGDDAIDRPGLVVPHPHMHERSFVLEPLAEIAGDVWHPVRRKSIESMRQALLQRRT